MAAQSKTDSRSAWWTRHIVTLFIACTAMATSYGSISARVEQNGERLNMLENNLLAMLSSLQRDVNDVKVDLARIAADIRWLKNGDDSE